MDILLKANVYIWRLAEFFLEIEAIHYEYVKEYICIKLNLF
jgi:hypothetical protein